MNYNEALEFIHSVKWKGSRPGLSRITELLSKLGDPQKKLKVVHVAGTNGKGSFCAMLDSILREQGYKTGLFTSPFVEEFNERIRLDGKNISDEKLAKYTERVKKAAVTMEDIPTEFEIITAIGFLFYAENGCEIGIIEAGMGGRLDSTNVFDYPLLSVITGIALDHTEYLGDTIEKIAYEKAGIIKPNTPVLFGGEDRAATKVIADKAKEKNAPFYVTERVKIENIRTSLNGTVFDFGEMKDVYIPLLGSYQPYNAANVLTAVKILSERGIKISEESIREGLKKAEWKARFERLSPKDNDVCVIFDGSHNIEGIEAAIRSIKTYFSGKVNLVMGVMRDKAYDKMVKGLSEVVNKAFTVTPHNDRALLSNELAKVFVANNVEATPFPDIESAVFEAISESEKTKTPLIILGSLYMYSDIKYAVNKYFGK